MIKSVARVSAWMAFAAVLSCAPCALGQVTVGKRAPSAGVSLLNHVPASFLALSIVPPFIGGHGSNNPGNFGNGGNSCGNQGGGPTGWENGGWNGWGGGGNGGGGGCSTSVPEGGSTWMYLLMAGFCCSGALLFRSKRQDASASAN